MPKEGINYLYVGKNIYKVGNRYRVRVGNYSFYVKTKKLAKSTRKRVKETIARDSIF